MIPRLALIDKGRHDEAVTAFIVFVAVVLGVGILSLRYGVDSRVDRRQL